MSINLRIALSASLVLAIFIVLTAAALERAFHDSAHSALEERLLGQLYLLMAEAEVDQQGQLNMPAILQEAQLNLPVSGLYAHITNTQGKILWQSPSTVGIQTPAPISLDTGEQQFKRQQISSGEEFYGLAFGIQWATATASYPLTFNIATDLAAFNAQISSYRHSLWGWLGALALLLLVTQAIVLRWGLQPLRQVAGEVAAIEAGNKEELTGEYPRELAGLTSNINTLIHNEHAQQSRYRNALADLAHSLKTPLSILRGAIDNKPYDKTSIAQLQTTLQEQITRMDNIVAHQLQRAATAGSSAIRAPILIRPVIDKILTSLQKVYHEKSIETVITTDAAIRYRFDEGDLMEVLGNLLDNAFKWCKQTICVEVKTTPDELTISVGDDGPGIAAQSAKAILMRGVRTDETVPGHGIGLSVVMDIIHAYHGQVSVSKSHLGGAQINLTLPK